MKKSQNKMETAFFKGPAFFAWLTKPSEAFNKKQWIVNVGLEGPELEKAKKLGMAIKDPNDNIPMPHIKLTRNFLKKSGETQTPPELIDAKKNPLPSNILIGNESKVVVKAGLYEHDGKTYGYLDKVQVVQLVPYGGETEFETYEDGFDASTQAGQTAVPTNVADTSDDESPFDMDDSDLAD